MAQLPKLPAAPKKDLPAPFKGGDRVLDKREVTSSLDVMDDPRGGRISRGVSMREDRGFKSPKDYQRMTSQMISEKPDEKLLSMPYARPASARRSTRPVSGRRR